MNTPSWLVKWVFSIDVVILVLLLISFPFVEPGSGSYVVAVLTLGITLFTMLSAAVVLLIDRWSDDGYES